ncbi:MAG: MBL fold metallo-hydrolase [Bacilli bacterium]|nr:MBL fold metallo-hydrolase [Bacilli bacterium]
MKISVLASGSKGNSSYIETKNTKILVDIGMPTLYIERKLKKINVNPEEIKGIILTHTHVDHINGLKVFIKKYDTKVYLTEKMLEDINNIFELKNYELITNYFNIDDLEVEVIKTSHDASDSNGYIFKSENKSISYITDTGYINRKYKEKLTNRDIYVIESNHDIKMLMEGKYPYHLKQRIYGDNGHLSNEMASKYLTEYIGTETKEIILIHLSHENNTEEKALETLKEKLKEKNIDFNNIIISSQNENTELIEI